MKRKNMLCVQQLVPIPALVEALGYGRDRTFFRAVGQRLVGLSSDIPEPAGRAAEPSPLDAGRLRTSGQLVEQWRVKGAWETIRNAIINVENTNVGSEEPGRGQAPPWLPCAPSFPTSVPRVLTFSYATLSCPSRRLLPALNKISPCSNKRENSTEPIQGFLLTR